MEGIPSPRPRYREKRFLRFPRINIQERGERERSVRKCRALKRVGVNKQKGVKQQKISS